MLLALWIALSSAAVLVWLMWPNGIAVDYAVFWRSVRASAPYAATAEPFAYPPTALVWLSPLRLIGLWPGYLAWTAVSIALFATAAWRLYGGAAAGLALLSPAVCVALVPGQSSLIAGAGLLGAFITRSPVMRGLLLGAVISFKPQLALLAPLFLLVNREFLALTAMTGPVALVSLIATAVFGPYIWIDWLSSISRFQQLVADRGLSLSAVSPGAFAPAVGLPEWPVTLAGCAMGAWIAVRAKGLPASETAALIAVASLFAAPYALRYDLAAAAPLMALLVITSSGRSALIACVAYSATLGPFSLLAAAIAALRRGR